MLLTKEENITNDYLPRGFQDPSKTSSYMPPIKSSEKIAKQFFSPTQFQSTKRLPPFNFPPQPPRKEYPIPRLEPFQSSMIPLTDKNAESFKISNKGISTNTKSKIGLRISPKLPGRMGEYNDNENRSESKENQTGTEQKQPNDPVNTFQTFMNRLTKLQVNGILPNPEPVKFSEKAHSIVRGFSVCTNQGLVRNYNEDRVSVILNITKPANRPANEYWPNCSIFGVFDGHGGNKCAEFLRNNLHQYIIKNKNFPWNPQEAIKEAFEETDRDFIENVLIESDEGKCDRSGSCCILLLLLDDTCYICNVGDSRALISQGYGNSCFALSRDHKPCDKNEQKRVLDAGGKVYQNFPVSITGKRIDLDPKNNPLNLTVPYRILPGRLAVSRAFGDIEAKMARFGGNPNVLISKPEITTIKLSKDHDFIFLGSDGIFDKMTNEEIIAAAWSTWKDKRTQNVHLALKNGVEHIIKQSMLNKSLDNVTGIIIAFSNFESYFDDGSKREVAIKADLLDELKNDYLKDARDSPLHPHAPYQRVPSSSQMHNGLGQSGLGQIEGTDPSKLQTPSRGQNYPQKGAGDMFDFTKYMDANARRGSDSLPRINTIKPKGY